MCLYGNDIDETAPPGEADLGWIVSSLTRRAISPAARCSRAEGAGVPRKLVGFEMVDRGIARHGYPATRPRHGGGVVTSGTYAPYLQKNIGLAYLPAARSAVGKEFDVEIRGRPVPARSCPRRSTTRAVGEGAALRPA